MSHPPARTTRLASRIFAGLIGAVLFGAGLLGGLGTALHGQESDQSRPLNEADAGDLTSGKRAYVAQCALCHGIDGSGGYGPSLLVPVLRRAADDKGLLRVVEQGIPNVMPGYGRANGPRRSWQLAAYVRSLNAGSTPAAAVPGDVGRGRAIYQERGCASCHVVGGSGRAFGPDLSEIGAQRGAAYIKQAILEPAARVPEGHVVVTATPKDARAVRGVRVSEDVFWVYVRDPGGRIHRYWKSDLEALERETGASLMPAYGAERRPTEIDDLVAYLASLRGEP
jgi:cytochrome c oxidase cbb3-type subunit III